MKEFFHKYFEGNSLNRYSVLERNCFINIDLSNFHPETFMYKQYTESILEEFFVILFFPQHCVSFLIKWIGIFSE